MSLPRKQNRDENEQRVLHVPTPQSVENKKVSLGISRTAEAPKFSRLSAQMVDLSLQQAQREPTFHDTLPAKVNAVSPPLRDTLPAKPKAVSSPLPWPSPVSAPPPPQQPQGTPRQSTIPNYWHNNWPNFRKEVRCNLDHWLAGARVSGAAAVRNLHEHAKSAQKKFAVSNFRAKSRFGTASRLWTSTGLAALSAVLVVGVILGARHYVHTPNTSQPSGGNTSPIVPAMQDISQPRGTSIVGTNGPATMQHPATSSAAAKHGPAKHASAEHSAAKPGTRKIRRKNKDDDYVAKDTFVSYGNKAKPAR